MPIVVDLTVVVLLAGITYALMSEGLWGAALMFFNVLFAGLIAFNFYEPLATLLATNVGAMSGYADTLCLLLLFVVTLLILRLTTEAVAPAMVRFPMPVYHIGRIAFGFAAACVTMAIILLSFHTAPIHKRMFWGACNYDRRPPFGLGLDWKWLGFFQFTTGQTFARYNNQPGGASFDPRVYDATGEYKDARVFDPYGRWLIDHQNARPYGEPTENVPPPPSGSEGASGGAEAGGGTPGGPSPGGPAGGGAGYPGGTAGAASGMAPIQ